MNSRDLKIKVCGMTLQQNVDALNLLDVDFVGNIFYSKSPRSITADVNAKATKVGVFVRETIEIIKIQVKKHHLQIVQLHGGESNEFCSLVKQLGVDVWKVFSVDDEFDFELLNEFENADLFLFDTKSPKHGGTGKKFNWDLLNKIDELSPKKYFLSGGIGSGDANEIKKLQLKNLIGLDLNSKFEKSPGIKDVELLKQFLKELRD
tara:strand:+ start:3170 stop:3787 length:618 start_codon:yes stop_codon:yes gene_type:complete